MSKYTQIIENAQPVAYYNCNDISGDIVDNINSLNFIDSGLLSYQQNGALHGEPTNKAITLGGLLKTPETLDTTNFGLEFSTEFWVKQNNSFSLNISEQFKFSINENSELIFPKKSEWNHRGLILQASDAADNDYFGIACSLSSDGNSLVVGAFGHDNPGTDTGAVYTYDRSGDIWIQRGLILQAGDAADNDYFGHSCSLSDDGNILVVGAYGHDNPGTNTGAVYTYDRSGDTWIQRGLILQAGDAATYDSFGVSCSLSDDGNSLVVGAHAHETTGTDTGAVYTYDRSGDTWIQRGTILQASDAATSDYFGISCNISGDGNSLVVGAHAHETTGSNTGAVYTYDRSGDTWIQRGTILQASDAADNDYFGYSCNISSDGNTIVVGAYAHDNPGTDTGAVYTYDRSGDTWIQRGLILQASDAANSDQFGRSCSLSNDGNTLVVGAYAHETTGIDTGAVYTYDISSIGKPLQLNEYNHIVLNYESGNISIYKNGSLIHTESLQLNFNATSYIQLISDSTIDELAVYDRYLSDYEIESHYYNALQLDKIEFNQLNSNPLVYLPMDDSYNIMNPKYGNIEGEYVNNPTLNNTGLHKDCVLFDGISQYARVNNSPDGDKYFNNVELLLHMEDFTDSSYKNHTISNSGATISNNVSKFNNSMYFDGVLNGMSSPASSDYVFGSDDFTVEAWVYFTGANGVAGRYHFIVDSDDISANRQWLLVITDSGDLTGQLFNFDGQSNRVVDNVQFKQNVWTHCAFTRSNNIIRLFKNGILVDSLDVTGVVTKVAPTTLYIGVAQFNGAQDASPSYSQFEGYIDELRVTNGIGRYTENFTPSNTQFEDANISESVRGDEYYDNVELLLHMDGANNSTVFTDSSKNNITIPVVGNTHISTTQAKFGQSVHFDGVGDYLTIPKNDRFNFSTNDFTLEFALYVTAYNANSSRLWYIDGDFYTGIGISLDDGGAISILMTSTSGSWNIVNYLSSIVPLNTWWNIAVVRSGINFYLYINGVRELITTNSAALYYNPSYDFVIGGQSVSADRGLYGYIDEFRITKGIARYTENYTPQSKPFYNNKPAIDYDWTFPQISDRYYNNVELLLHMDGANNSTVFTDSSKNNLAISTIDNTHISTTQAKFGQSGYFDGSGDYLVTTNVSGLHFEGSDFSVEGWINLSTIKATAIISISNSTVANREFDMGVDVGGYLYCVLQKGVGDYITLTSTSNNLSPNTWYHVAITRYGDTIGLYVNGILSGSFVYTFPLLVAATQLTIGRISWDTAYDAHGYIDEFRITKGIARYIESFTPPERQFPDVYTESQGLSIECWFNCVAVAGSSYNTIFSKGSELENALTIQDSVFTTSGTISFQESPNSISTVDNISIGLSTWNHIAITFDSDIISIYLNGAVIGKFTFKYPTFTNKDFYIASDENNTYPSNMYISDFAIHEKVLTESEVKGRFDVFSGNQDVSAILYDDYVALLAPTSYYKMNDISTHIEDCIGGNHGTLNGVTTGLQSDSLIPADINNKSIDLTSSYVLIPYKENYSKTLTISLNMKINSYNTDTNANMWLCRGGDRTTPSISPVYIGVDSQLSGNKFAFYFTSWVSSTITAELGVTYNVVVTMSNDYISMYINGVFAFGSAIPITTYGNISVITDTNEINSNIIVDELMVFDGKELSAIEIQNLYTKSQLKFVDNSTDYYAYVSTLAPINYYKFNDTTSDIIDEIGGYNGVLTGDYQQRNTSLLNCDTSNRSILLNTTGLITFDGSELLNTTYTTFSFIFELHKKTNDIYALNGSANIYYMFIKMNGSVAEFGYWNGDLGIYTNSGIVLEEGVKYHITMVISNTGVDYYIDGNFVITKTMTTGRISLYDIGRAVTERNFTIDELMVFDKALTAPEITNLYNKANLLSFGASLPDYNALVAQLTPIHYYKFNDDNTTTIKDEIGDKNFIITGSEYEMKYKSLINYDIINNKSMFFEIDCLLTAPVKIDTLFSKFTLHEVFEFNKPLIGNTSLFTSDVTGASLYVDVSTNELNYWNGSLGYASGYTIELNTTYIIDCIFALNTITIYLNGIYIIQLSVPTPNFTAFDRIGAVGNILNVDEVIVFDRELTGIDILKLYQASMTSLDKDNSFEHWVHNSNPDNYYKLSDTTTKILDSFGANDGVLLGNTYQQLDNSILLSNINNKSTTLNDSYITLSSTASVDVKTLGFFINILELPTTQDISILSGAIKTYAFIDRETNRLAFDNGTTIAYSDFTFDENIIYHVVINYTSTYVEWYINGDYDSRVLIDSFLNGSDTIASIGESLGNIKLDEIIIYNDKNLIDTDIYKLYNLAQYDYELLSGYRIHGTTQIEGSYRQLDIRLYQHDNGGLMYQTKSDISGNYSFTGLHNMAYDIVFYEEGNYGTCQQIYMNLFPEIYKY